MYSHKERHQIKRSNWLRASVLGANDGIISTASLIMGVAAAHTSHNGILVAGTTGLFAGAMSMAAGEYISVSTQKDCESAQLQIEKRELETNAEAETEELTVIYMKRGLQRSLARQVAEELMKHNALESHARDELGITEQLKARPYQASFSSGLSFTIGSLLPLLIAIFMPKENLIPAIFIMSVIFLGILGALAAKVGGSKPILGIIRVVIWGSLALLVNVIIGSFLRSA